MNETKAIFFTMLVGVSALMCLLLTKNISDYVTTKAFIKAGYSQVVVAGKQEPIWIKGDSGEER